MNTHVSPFEYLVKYFNNKQIIIYNIIIYIYEYTCIAI